MIRQRQRVARRAAGQSAQSAQDGCSYREFYYSAIQKQIATSSSIWCQRGIVSPTVQIRISLESRQTYRHTHADTHTLHHFTRHQTLTKSLFSAACWHSNSGLTESHAGRILITASQSQSCMGESYLHMRGEGVHPTHCLHTSPPKWDVYLCAHLRVRLSQKRLKKKKMLCKSFVERTSFTFLKSVQIFPVEYTGRLNLLWEINVIPLFCMVSNSFGSRTVPQSTSLYFWLFEYFKPNVAPHKCKI